MSTANRIILIAGMGTFSAVQTGTALAYQERVSLKKSPAAAQKALMNSFFKKCAEDKREFKEESR